MQFEDKHFEILYQLFRILPTIGLIKDTYSNSFISKQKWKDISTINDCFFRSKPSKGTYTILRKLTCKLR